MNDQDEQSSGWVNLTKYMLILFGIFLLFAVSDRCTPEEQNFSEPARAVTPLPVDFGTALLATEPDPALTRMIHHLRRLAGQPIQPESAANAAATYVDQLDDFRRDFTTAPDGFLVTANKMLTSDSVGDFEKYLMIHVLGHLSLPETRELLKIEIERPIPAAGAGGEDGLSVIEAIARKFAAIEALAQEDRDYLLDLIEEPTTRSAVRRAAVEAFVASDANLIDAVLEIKPLLKKTDYYMILPYLQPPGTDGLRRYFLGDVVKSSGRMRNPTGNPTIDLAAEPAEVIP